MIDLKGKLIQLFQMSRRSKNFHYLFAGQGRGARKRYVRNMIVAFFVGILASALVLGIAYLIEK